MTTVDFARRSSATELMDSPSIGFDEFHQCLRQLTIVNGCVLAYRPTLRWLKAMLRDAPADKTISILDVGSGGGDMLRKIRQLTRQRGINAELTGVDLNPWAKQSAEFDTPPEMNIRYETSDIFAFDPLRRADYIMKYRLDEVIRQRVAVQVVDEPAAPGVAVHPLDEAHERGIAEVMDEIAVTPLRSSRNQFVEAASSAALCAKSCRYYSSAAHRGTQ
ncbi:MAG TPA: hypothetical protein VL976_01925 [Xanthobacteraceae bacterium]|nr:hypothetical protein [Xanthobacteraceae bacterium]